MESLFKFIFELILEGCVEGVKSRRLPLFLRVILASIVLLIFLFVVGILLILVYNLLYAGDIIAGLFILLLILFFFIMIIIKGKIYISDFANNK